MATESKAVESVDEAVAKANVGTALIKARVLQIQNEKDWVEARTLRREIALLEKKLEKHFDALKAPYNKARGEILGREKEIIAKGTEKFYELVDPKIIEWEEHDVRSRIALQRRLQDEARKTAEEDREAAALELEKEGDIEGAKAAREQPLYVPAIVIPEFSSWLPGEGRNEVYSIDEEGSNLMELVLAVATGTAPLAALKMDTTVIGAMAKSMKETFNLPGVKIVRRTGITQAQK